MITVTGIMTNPAATRAAAPVARFPELESFGRAEVLTPLLLATRIEEPFCTSPCRRALRLVKYKADPKPVRSAEGRVPRHNPRIGLEEERMVLSVGRRAVVWWDCCTRVFKRSAGWRRMEDVRPEQRPAAKWKVDFDAIRRRRG